MLDWTAPALMAQWAKPTFGVSIGAVTAATATAPQEAYYNNNYATVPTANGSGSYSEVFAPLVQGRSTTTEGLNAEVSRFVKLGWQVDGVYFSNMWVYKN